MNAKADGAGTVIRTSRYRLIPGTVANAKHLARTAGGCRYVWNTLLARNNEAYAAWKAGEGERPEVSFFSLGKHVTAMKREPGHDWLNDLHAATLRYASHRLAVALKRFFDDEAAGPPTTGSLSAST